MKRTIANVNVRALGPDDPAPFALVMEFEEGDTLAMTLPTAFAIAEAVGTTSISSWAGKSLAFDIRPFEPEGF